MKDRLLTFALAMAALVLFYVLVAPKPAGPQEEVSRPLSTEDGPNGYLAMRRWFDSAGLETLVLRERYDRLDELTGGIGGGHLLITTAPHLFPIRHSEVGALREWIAAGNTLLVLAGLADTPEWSMGAGMDREFLQNLRLMTGMAFTSATPTPADTEDDEDDEDDERQNEDEDEGLDPVLAYERLAEPRRDELVPNGPHPLFEGVQAVVAISEYPASQWHASADRVDFVLELAQNPQAGAPVMWLARYAKGQVIVSGYASIFTNKLLGERDNAQLLANLARWGRASGGRIILDDAHQGAVSFYDPAAFFGDSRLHRSLLWVLALWLVFVLGPQRLRSRLGVWQPVDTTAFVRATGGFLARVVTPAAAARQLFEHFFNDIRARIGLPQNGAPVWEWLTMRGNLAAGDLALMQELHARAASGRRLDLAKLHNLLVRTRRTLA